MHIAIFVCVSVRTKFLLCRTGGTVAHLYYVYKKITISLEIFGKGTILLNFFRHSKDKRIYQIIIVNPHSMKQNSLIPFIKHSSRNVLSWATIIACT